MNRQLPRVAPLIATAWIGGFLLLGPAASAESATDYRYSTDWTSANAEQWIRYLAPLQGQAKARGLEVGCFEGRSSIWFLEEVLTHPDARMACVDVFTEQIEANFDHNLKVSGQADRMVKFKGYSQDVLRALEYDSFDFIYIDGCHLASCALQDAVLSWDLLRPGGFLIFDDYFYNLNLPPSERPKLAIDAFIESFVDQIRVHQIGSQVILEKKHGLGDKERVGNPIVHDPEWLDRLKRLQDWSEKKNRKQPPQPQ